MLKWLFPDVKKTTINIKLQLFYSDECSSQLFCSFQRWTAIWNLKKKNKKVKNAYERKIGAVLQWQTKTKYQCVKTKNNKRYSEKGWLGRINIFFKFKNCWKLGPNSQNSKIQLFHSKSSLFTFSNLINLQNLKTLINSLALL